MEGGEGAGGERFVEGCEVKSSYSHRTEGPVWISHKIRYAGAWNHDNKGALVRYTKPVAKQRERETER